MARVMVRECWWNGVGERWLVRAAQDEDLFVLNKPARLAVQGGSKGERHLDGMLHLFAEEGAERPRLVTL